jgi:hypothetical protein
MIQSLNHPSLQRSVQGFFQDISWSGQVALSPPPSASGRFGQADSLRDSLLQTFHPGPSKDPELDPSDLMASVRVFMAQIPWSGAERSAILAPATADQPNNNPPSLDAFSDFF